MLGVFVAVPDLPHHAFDPAWFFTRDLLTELPRTITEVHAFLRGVLHRASFV